MPGWIGPWEIALFLVVALLVFGPKRLPELGRSMGKGMRDFKKAVSGDDNERDEIAKAISLDEDRIEIVDPEVVEPAPVHAAEQKA